MGRLVEDEESKTSAGDKGHSARFIIGSCSCTAGTAEQEEKLESAPADRSKLNDDEELKGNTAEDEDEDKKEAGAAAGG